MHLCGDTSLIVRCTACGKHHAIPSHCDVRLCPKCEKRRWGKTTRKHVKAFSGLRMELVTFCYGIISYNDTKTVRMVKGAVRDILKGFYGGGLFAVEVTEREMGNFYLHAHAVVPKKYIHHFALSQSWERRTGRYVVWIGGRPSPRRPNNSSRKLAYVLKYCHKAPNLSEEGKLFWLNLFYRTRLSGTCGTFYGFHQQGEASPRQPKCSTCQGPCVKVSWSLWDAESWNEQYLRTQNINGL